MAAQHITVVVNGETLAAPIRPSVEMAFEGVWKFGYLAALNRISDPEGRVEHIYWLAWESLRRANLYTKRFDNFKEEVDEFPVISGVEAGSGPLPETA